MKTGIYTIHDNSAMSLLMVYLMNKVEDRSGEFEHININGGYYGYRNNTSLSLIAHPLNKKAVSKFNGFKLVAPSEMVDFINKNKLIK